MHKEINKGEMKNKQNSLIEIKYMEMKMCIKGSKNFKVLLN